MSGGASKAFLPPSLPSQPDPQQQPAAAAAAAARPLSIAISLCGSLRGDHRRHDPTGSDPESQEMRTGFISKLNPVGHSLSLSLSPSLPPRENFQTRQTKCQDINGKKMTCKIHLTSRSLLPASLSHSSQSQRTSAQTAVYRAPR